MKPLLTTLIAALVFVLPLRADEPTQSIAVRVIDHAGNPISGLALSVEVGEQAVHSFTDEAGLLRPLSLRLGFETPISVTIQAENWIRLGFSPMGNIAILSSADRGPTGEVVSRHSELVRSYAFDGVTYFEADDIVDGVVTMQAPEAARCTVRLRLDEWPIPETPGSLRSGWLLWRIGGNAMQISEQEFTDSIVRDAPDGEIVSEHVIMVPRGRRALIAARHNHEYYLIEIEPDSTEHGDFEVDFDIPLQTEPSARVKFLLRSDDTPSGYHLVRADAKSAQWLPVIRISNSNDQAIDREFNFDISSGEYLILPLGTPWSDTLLRLRRGEDLPHLKRITIPEGGTVELSSEDFIDPSAEAPPAEADPR
ncbi:MAG: hypothetical protein ACIAQF_06590 [Phycisphaerales bacterium JB065]